MNPYLPQYEYIPDGEPHVFGDRVYLYGSHDRFDGKKFCLNDYVCYSADVKNLKNWRYEGVIYTKTQDPRMTDGTHELWAPDVVQGKDGRYYLYYCPDDKIRSIGVAVCDTPAGKYQFYGLVQDENGGILGERPADTIAFDPGVFIDEDGSVYLYSGNGPRTKKAIGKEPKASVVMQLCDDMITLKKEPSKLLPTLGEAEGTGFEGHEFFEASSIRKIQGQYYLVYSSVKLHELCYAVSDHPDRDYRYGGVLVSNADVIANSPDQTMKNCYGNNHGGLECINGAYYIFYHRQTNRTMFSRQGCIEKLQLLPDGSIPQVHISSTGADGVLPGRGYIPAGNVCILYGKHSPAISHPLAMGMRHPYVTQDGPEFDPEDTGIPPRQFIANGKRGLVAGFRWFDLQNTQKITVTLRGNMRGILEIRTDPEGNACGKIEVTPSKQWQTFSGSITAPAGAQELYFCYLGRGKLDMLGFEMA